MKTHYLQNTIPAKCNILIDEDKYKFVKAMISGDKFVHEIYEDEKTHLFYSSIDSLLIKKGGVEKSKLVGKLLPVSGKIILNASMPNHA